MRCDFTVCGGIKYCIRCKAIVNSPCNYRTCDATGLGDRIFRITEKLGFRSCQSCIARRNWLNELDRKVFRRLVRCRKSLNPE